LRFYPSSAPSSTTRRRSPVPRPLVQAQRLLQRKVALLQPPGFPGRRRALRTSFQLWPRTVAPPRARAVAPILTRCRRRMYRRRH
jgi:hypothetical protein